MKTWILLGNTSKSEKRTTICSVFTLFCTLFRPFWWGLIPPKAESKLYSRVSLPICSNKQSFLGGLTPIKMLLYLSSIRLKIRNDYEIPALRGLAHGQALSSHLHWTLLLEKVNLKLNKEVMVRVESKSHKTQVPSIDRLKKPTPSKWLAEIISSFL